MFYTFLLILTRILTVKTNFECSNTPSPKYHVMEKCYRSKLGIVAKANYSSLSSCQRLGIEKRGLAINFSPLEARTEGGETLEYSCEVLKCAETDGGLSLDNDTRYDYYSLYAKPLPHVNSTCVAGIGMFFLITKRVNYTQAVRECRKTTGVLADILSEQRTDALAQVLAGADVDAAFVGLRRKDDRAFLGVRGDSLDCTTYRAWAPGHPRRRRHFDCVVLSRNRTWRSTPCKKTYSTLCELIPGGPYKRGSIFSSKHLNITIDEAVDD